MPPETRYPGSAALGEKRECVAGADAGKDPGPRSEKVEAEPNVFFSPVAQLPRQLAAFVILSVARVEELPQRLGYPFTVSWIGECKEHRELPEKDLDGTFKN